MAYLLIGAAALLLRVGLALKPGLWGDEIFSLAMATGHSLEHPARDAVADLGDYLEPAGAQPAAAFRRFAEHDARPAGPGRVIRAVFLSDTSPPLYYVLLNAWTRFTGTSDASLRLFSAVWGLLSLPLLWLVGRALGGPRIAAIATVLFAFSPLALYYSAEGRMYSLAWFLALVLAWSTLRMADRGPRPPTVAVWVVSGAAGLLTHYFFAFVWLACVAWLALRPGRFRRVYLALAACTVLVVIAPWYTQVPASIGRWRVTAGWLDHPLSPAQVVSAPFKLASSLVSGRGVWGGSEWLDRFAAIAYAGLIVVAVRRGVRPLFAGGWLLVWLWLAGAVLGPVAFDLLRDTNASQIARYALPGLPAAMLLAALGIAQLTHRFQAAFVALLVLLWMPANVDIFTGPGRQWRPYRVLAAHLDQNAAAGDLVIVHSIPSGVIGVARYLRGPTPMASWVMELEQRRMPEALEALLEGRCRAVLVKVHYLVGPSPAETWLEENAVLESVERTALDRRAEISYFRGWPTSDTPGTHCPESHTPGATAPGAPVPLGRRTGA